MPRLSDATREKARKEGRRWGRVRRWGGLGSAAAAIALPGAAFPPWLAIGIPVGLMIAVFAGDKKADSANEKANDPPRDDYWVSTEIEEPSFIPAALGDEPLLSAAANLGITAAYTSAYERAMVVAHERADGARAAGDKEAEAARMKEARDFGRLAAEHDHALAEAAEEFAMQLESHSDADAAIAEALPNIEQHGSFVATLPPEVLDRLRAAYIDPDAFDVELEPVAPEERAEAGLDEAPLRALARALRDAAAASREYAEQYQSDQASGSESEGEDEEEEGPLPTA